MKKYRELLARKDELKGEVREFLDGNEVTKAEEKMEEVRALDKQIAIEKELMEEEREVVEEKIEIRKEDKEMTIEVRELEERAIKGVLLNKELSEEERKAITVADNGALLPNGFVKQLEDIRQGYAPLKQYTQVIPVATNSGKMPVSTGTETKGLANLQEDDKLVEEMINTEQIDYAVEELGKITPVQNAVLEDSGISVMDLIGDEFIENSVYTENTKIIKALDGVAKAKTVANGKELVTAINLMSPIARAKGVVVCNPLGFDFIDNMRDENGRPLLKELADGSGVTLKGMIVEVVDEDIITGAKPIIYVADMKKAVKFFDRKGIEIGADTSAGFTRNRTLVRVIQRLDVKAGKLGKKAEKFAIKVTVNEVAETK